MLSLLSADARFRKLCDTSLLMVANLLINVLLKSIRTNRVPQAG